MFPCQLQVDSYSVCLPKCALLSHHIFICTIKHNLSVRHTTSQRPCSCAVQARLRGQTPQFLSQARDQGLRPGAGESQVSACYLHYDQHDRIVTRQRTCSRCFCAPSQADHAQRPPAGRCLQPDHVLLQEGLAAKQTLRQLRRRGGVSAKRREKKFEQSLGLTISVIKENGDGVND